jgi:septal ring factor EnvC (AmiA/AmiB activator)
MSSALSPVTCPQSSLYVFLICQYKWHYCNSERNLPGLQAREESVQLATELSCIKQQAELHGKKLHQAQKEISALKASGTTFEATVSELQAERQSLRADLREIEMQRDSALKSLETQAEQMQVTS